MAAPLLSRVHEIANPYLNSSEFTGIDRWATESSRPVHRRRELGFLAGHHPLMVLLCSRKPNRWEAMESLHGEPIAPIPKRANVPL